MESVQVDKMKVQREFKQTEIGKIPKEWEVVRLGDAITYRKGIKPKILLNQKEENTLPYLTADVLRMGTFTQWARETDESVKVNKNDVVLIWDGFYCGDAFIGFEGIVSSTMIKIEAELNLDKYFLFYFLKTHFKELNTKISGMYLKHVNKSVFKNLKLPLPPLPEQQKIAEILSTVDSAIEKVNQAIEKTQRLKKGLMQELLTKGIGHREFKETEIGRIPKDWEVVRIFDIADVKGGKRVPKGHALVGFKTPYPYLRVVDFRNMGINTGNIKYLLPETYKLIRRYIISSNDVYISIAGTIGLAGLIPGELNGVNLTENAAKLFNLRNIAKEFLAYVLNSSIVQNQILALVGKAQQPKLALFRIEKIKLPLPLLPEQQKIAEILSTVDKRLELLGRKREKLERIKKGLMNDLLTGRRRVSINLNFGV